MTPDRLGDSKLLTRLLAELDDRRITTTTDCVAAGCRLVLDTLCLCMSCDNSMLFAGLPGKKPDFLIAAHDEASNRFCWVVVEIKPKSIPSKAADQLQAAADVIASSTPPAPAELIPLVLHQPGAKNDGELLVRSKKKIRYHGKPRPVIARLCGTSLSDVLAVPL